MRTGTGTSYGRYFDLHGTVTCRITMEMNRPR